jgi:chlorophyll synthase
VLSFAVALFLGTWVAAAASAGLVLAWAYSAPPFRLKQNGWWGNSAVAISYEGLAWLTGAAVMAGGGLPEWRIFALAGLYSAGAHGIMTLNDFKSIEGDRQMGIGSLPVRLGVEQAARVACEVMVYPQLIVIALLITWDRPYHAAAIGALVVIQLWMMNRFLQSPKERALWYSAAGVPVYVSGMMISAFALRLGAQS